MFTQHPHLSVSSESTDYIKCDLTVICFLGQHLDLDRSGGFGRSPPPRKKNYHDVPATLYSWFDVTLLLICISSVYSNYNRQLTWIVLGLIQKSAASGLSQNFGVMGK